MKEFTFIIRLVARPNACCVARNRTEIVSIKESDANKARSKAELEAERIAGFLGCCVASIREAK